MMRALSYKDIRLFLDVIGHFPQVFKFCLENTKINKFSDNYKIAKKGFKNSQKIRSNHY